MKLYSIIEQVEDTPGASVSPKAPFQLPSLPFPEDAIPSFANEETMKLHREVHHRSYIDKLNEAARKNPELRGVSPKFMFEAFRKGEYMGEAKDAVERYAGGHINHSLFWEMLTPENTQPSKQLLAAINKQFGSMEDMKSAFSQTAGNIFGSGWAWLVFDPDVQSLYCMHTTNQRNPAMSKYPCVMLLGLDLWEHAFYLTHRTNKESYLDSFWGVVNWDHCNTVYASAQGKDVDDGAS